MKQNKKRAFTLVELIVVIAVIGILAAVLIPTFSGATQSANRAAVQATSDAYRKAYLSLASTKGTGCKYYKTVDVTEIPGARHPIYHAPFGPAELADFADMEELEGLKLVCNSISKNLPSGDDSTPGKVYFDLVGFVYLDISRGYYGYFNAENNQFEILSVSELPPEEESSSDSVYSRIINQHFMGASVLPKYWYPGVESIQNYD